MQIEVHSYAGHRADQRPERFYLRKREFEVEEVLDQWYSPGATYFRVRAQDGNFYILCHEEPQDCWLLVGFRRQATSAG